MTTFNEDFYEVQATDESYYSPEVVMEALDSIEEYVDAMITRLHMSDTEQNRKMLRCRLIELIA